MLPEGHLIRRKRELSSSELSLAGNPVVPISRDIEIKLATLQDETDAAQLGMREHTLAVVANSNPLKGRQLKVLDRLKDGKLPGHGILKRKRKGSCGRTGGFMLVGLQQG